MNLKYLKFITATIICFCLTTINVFSESKESTALLSIYQDQKKEQHTVSSKETVYSIARLYDLKVEDIYAVNPQAVNGVKVGDILVIPLKNNKNLEVSIKTHTAKAKETLYSISKEYEVAIEDLIRANPDLSKRPLAEGQILKIPAKNESEKKTDTQTVASSTSKPQFITHKVEPKETIYGISRQYDVTTEALLDFNPSLKDGLKDGVSLIIPVLETSKNRETLTDVTKVSVGIILPFVSQSAGKSARFIEYYEGFLLALSEMKSKGLSANVYVFDMGSDTGTEKLKSLLETTEMKYLDVVIGGVSPEQVQIIAEFAKKEGVKYVIPFPTKENNVLNNAEVFQVNAPHDYLYSNVASVFTRKFPNANVIYITENDSKGDKIDFVDALNVDLSRSGITSVSVVDNQNLNSNLSARLDPVRKNVIIPTSSSSKMLSSLISSLNAISADNTVANISLFGYADWQTYTQFNKDFAKYDTYIYTPFYLNEGDYRSQQFQDKYKQWYGNKALINTYPKYGVLGYDTGMAFLTALKAYGKNFDSNLNSLSIVSLQTPFLFKKQGLNDGYMNNGFYLVHYKSDGSIEKIEYGK